jgi:RNA polymerase sigma factor (sigma-70 family)
LGLNKAIRLDYGSTHRDVVERCKGGDRQAQFELYRLYSQAMYNICLRMLGNQHDAEDLLQNSFVDVFRHLQSFRYQSSVGAWIKRIVVNNCINHLKKRRLAITELNERTVSDEPDSGFQESYQPKLSVETVKKAVAALPDGYRVVFSLYMFEGYDHKEIGEILDISEATSKSQYSRAKRKLRELLESEMTIHG